MAGKAKESEAGGEGDVPCLLHPVMPLLGGQGSVNPHSPIHHKSYIWLLLELPLNFHAMTGSWKKDEIMHVATDACYFYLPSLLSLLKR